MRQPRDKRRAGGRPSRSEGEQIGERILSIAAELFLAHGYGATSIEAVARRAGISKRTFYHRFPDKAALFSAVLHRLITRLRPADALHLFEGKSLEAMLIRLAGIILHASLAPDSLALHRMIVSEAIRFPELVAALEREGARQEAVTRIAGLLRREISPALSAEKAETAAEQFLQMVVSVPQRRALGLGTPMTERELADWAESAVRLFLHGCAGIKA